MKLAEPDPPTPCPPSPDAKPFPKPRKTADPDAPGFSPLDDLGQGDSYADAYIAARDHNDGREADIAAHDKLCADLHDADMERHERKQEAREQLRKQVTKPERRFLGLF